MTTAALSPAVLLAIGLHGARADTGDTGTLSACLSVEAPSACDTLTDKGLAVVSLSVLGAAGLRRRRDLIEKLRDGGVLPEDVAAQLSDAEAREGAVDGQVDAGDVR